LGARFFFDQTNEKAGRLGRPAFDNLTWSSKAFVGVWDLALRTAFFETISIVRKSSKVEAKHEAVTSTIV
jgi:hypothetical protein